MTPKPLLPEILHLQNPDSAFAYVAGEDSLAGVNDTICELLGYDADTLLSLAPSAIIDDFERLTNNGYGLLETGDLHAERALITRNGRRIPAHLRSHSMQVDGREVTIFVARDITGLIRSRRLEKQGEKCFRTIYALSRRFDDPEQAIVDFALEQSRKMTGSSIAYIYLVNADESKMTLHSWSADPNLKLERTTPVTCRTDETELLSTPVRRRHPVIVNPPRSGQGRQDYAEMPVPIVRHMGVPVIDNGRVVLIAGVANKDEDYMEADMAHFSLPMETVWRIIERKRSEADLISAMQSAERANMAKSQFLANMSHELRTPLNGIMGMTQLLLGTDITNEQKEYLKLSMEAALHLSKVMTSLLDLSSIESGAVNIMPVNFNLPDTLESLIKPLALQAAEKSLILIHEIRPDVPTLINGDEKKLRQILINLIYNAIKFTEQGEVTLTVSRTATSSGLLGDMAELRFTVADTGIGIPEDKQEAIFESFVLGEDYLTKRYGGTGLGLSISRELATAMGGSIVVRSQPGQGSTFTLTLPFLLRDSGGGSCAIVDPPSRPERPLDILVAEDEQVNALVTSGILKKRGHSVTLVANGQHAIDALMGNAYDMVLMDVQMPVINGLEVTEIIRRGGAENVSRDIPVIGLTAYATDADLQRCLDAGMNSVVTKPFEAEDLLTAICRAAPPE